MSELNCIPGVPLKALRQFMESALHLCEGQWPDCLYGFAAFLRFSFLQLFFIFRKSRVKNKTRFYSRIFTRRQRLYMFCMLTTLAAFSKKRSCK